MHLCPVVGPLGPICTPIPAATPPTQTPCSFDMARTNEPALLFVLLLTSALAVAGLGLALAAVVRRCAQVCG